MQSTKDSGNSSSSESGGVPEKPAFNEQTNYVTPRKIVTVSLWT